ncbi:hypothetical protein BKA56DRAFT_584949 [Ilyonectria sp. MPI-CAGE-AT-0026]|nr:hypothetical protein BKA56DRAFT_584949 [Ilyonectria sp. MPI-CAGE-AT-0026]
MPDGSLARMGTCGHTPAHWPPPRRQQVNRSRWQKLPMVCPSVTKCQRPMSNVRLPRTSKTGTVGPFGNPPPKSQEAAAPPRTGTE